MKNRNMLEALALEGKLGTHSPVMNAMLLLPRSYFLTPEVQQEAFNSPPVRLSKYGFNVSYDELPNYN